MNPIKDSRIKEGFRVRNENEAKNQEMQIINKMNYDISQLTPKRKHRPLWFIVAGLGVGIVFVVFLNILSLILGAGLGVVLWLIANAGVSNYNNNLVNKKIQIQQHAQNEINQVYVMSDQKTLNEINEYDNEVKKYCQKVLSNSNAISPMVDHVTMMFQRMVSHADNRSHMKFIQADFIYEVLTSGIKFYYNSTYSNPRDDYDFNIQRYKNLNSFAECEGLAQALAKMTMVKMKMLYPPNSMSITISHNDAKVTMVFKGANPNFVPARNIL